MCKRFMILISLGMTIFVGCSSENTNTSENPQDPLHSEIASPQTTPRELAIRTVNLFIAEEYNELYNSIEEDTQLYLGVYEFVDTCKAITEALGTHIENESFIENFDYPNSYTIVEIYENGRLVLDIAISENGNIDSIFANVIPLTEKLIDNDIFFEQEVTVGSEENLPLGATLTIPKNIDYPPVVILVQGSGSTDRNESVFMNTPFLDIAHGLAEQGIASIRYDKRYFVYPEEAEILEENLTLREEVLDDVNSIVQLLLNEQQVNSSQIYIAGHSLGGMLAPAIAYENPEIAGILSLAGSPRPLYEISYDQNQMSMEYMLANDPEMYDTLADVFTWVENDIEILRGNFDGMANDSVLLGIYAGYQKSAKQYAGENFVHLIDIPMFIAQGDADFQVSVDKDFVAWQNVLENKENVTYKIYEGLNHLLMPTTGLMSIEDYTVKNNVSPELISDMANFIHSHKQIVE
ncbi:MAG: hypothetical protein ATN36_08455 [Epulopiscium sp. Nele67-Bin005]|nr:MAG: hypothetical protein ATN36_08455 [Epulopiscium sp. Nele67-Bin005]